MNGSLVVFHTLVSVLFMSHLKGFFADLLIQTLQATIGIGPYVRVLDCCARDTGLVFALMKHFSVVGSNDIDTQQPTQMHFDVQDPQFWQTIVASSYHAVCSQPPRSLTLINMIVSSSLSFCDLFCALLLQKQEIAQYKLRAVAQPKFVLFVNGLDYVWAVWLSPSFSKCKGPRSATETKDSTLTSSVPTHYVNFPASLIDLWNADGNQFCSLVDSEVRRVLSCSNLLQPNYEVSVSPPLQSTIAMSSSSDHELVPLFVRKCPQLPTITDDVETQCLKVYCPVPRHAQPLGDTSPSGPQPPAASFLSFTFGPSVFSAFSPSSLRRPDENSHSTNIYYSSSDESQSDRDSASDFTDRKSVV